MKRFTRSVEIKRHLILALFAVVGVLARKGIVALTTYDGSYLGGVVWANFAACTIMGALVESQYAWIGEKPKSEYLLYLGATTGFCGTCSSFSSLILEAFVKSANIMIGGASNYPNAGYGVMECLSVMIAQMCISIAGFGLGRQLIQQYDPPSSHIAMVESILAVAGLCSWIAVTALMAIPGWRSWMFACVVSPLACWMRYHISKWLNPRNKEFPLGTFTVNVIATVLLAVLNLLGRGKVGNGRIVNTVLSCHIIQGLEDGLCGTLSTVSTFVSELHSLKLRSGYIYAGVSLSVCYALMLLILGSYNWTWGLLDPMCS